jgi:excisionase family DNA binding protein
MPTTTFSDDEIELLASRLADILLPRILSAVNTKGKLIAKKSQSPLMSASEVAKRIGTRTKHVYEMAADGRIPSVKVGRYVRFDRILLEDAIRNGTLNSIMR